MERIIISESGIKTKEDVKKIISAGADAILIGTTIIQSLKNKNYTKYDGVYITTRNFIEALQ
jgi:indole-3-glycerol phosphate synthase